MVELLVVILIIAILVALLVPVLGAAVRRARQASVTAEINVIATGLTQFKAAYGFYPPSRLYVSELGEFPTGGTSSLAGTNTTDLTQGQLAQRSLRYLQRMFPRVSFTTYAPPGSGILPANINGTSSWYDFNGDGSINSDYILQGDQCLVFFMGGVPIWDPGLGTFTGMGGFGKNPVNPFSNSITSSSMGSLARTTPIFEFKNSRLAAIPGRAPFPSYFDLSGNGPAAGNWNVYAYFASYDGAGYDANDVNFAEPDPTGAAPTLLSFTPNFPVFDGTGTKAALMTSPSPNPYTNSRTIGGGGIVSYQQPQSYQLISAGGDGIFGPGGQYSPSASDSTPYDSVNYPYSYTDPSVRTAERDNLSNFATGPLN